MADCIFCKIVKKDIPASIVYEDKDLLAFMNINAIREGHILVIPKEHIVNFYELNDVIYQNIMKTVKILSKKINILFKPKKVGVGIMGFDVNHAHVHVLPLYEYHDITSQIIIENKTLKPSRDELDKLAEKIRSVKL